MSDTEDYPDNNYGIGDEYATSFNPTETELDESDTTEQTHLKLNPEPSKKPLDIDNVSVPKFEKNPRIKADYGDENGGLDDLLDLINEADEQNEKEQSNDNLDEFLDLLNDEEKMAEENQTRKKIVIPKKKPEDSKIPTTSTASCSSITITTFAAKSASAVTENTNILVEKNTGLRLLKSPFKNEIEINVRLMTDLGKFLKLTEVSRRSFELKEQGDKIKWYSIFILGSKSDTKSSAKGNNYAIWRIFDAANLDKEQEISLFLFGGAYKTHWKSSEFEVFALVQPDVLDSKKPNTGQNNNTNSSPYYNPNSAKKAGNFKSTSNWNKFASTKVDLSNKLTLSTKSDFQLIPLGIAKDITNCQSNTNPNVETQDPVKRCKNIVNLQEAPYCIYHCKQLDKTNKFGKNPPQASESKYSMSKPSVNRFGTTSLFKSTVTPDVKFAPSAAVAVAASFKESDDGTRWTPNGRVSMANKKLSQIEERKKVCKEMKTEILSSLTKSIADTVNPVIGILGKGKGKRSDQELLAAFDGKVLKKEELLRIRISENQAGIRRTTGDTGNKEMEKLFSSKVLLPSENNSNSTITSQKMLELKREKDAEAAAAIVLNDYDYAAGVKKKVNEGKNSAKLAAGLSHKEICKQIKKNEEEKGKKKEGDKEDEEEEEEEEDVEIAVEKQVTKAKTGANSVVASSFLKQRFSEIKSKENVRAALKAPMLGQSKISSGFDLDLYIGDSLCTKKLLDVNSKYINHSPATATTAGYKRKLTELKSPQSSPTATPESSKPGPAASPVNVDSNKAKKLKLIDDLLNIKSSHVKEVNDPEKNPHLKSYFEKLHVQEKIDDKLSATKTREVNAVTCKLCNYTSFSQSEYCKNLRHMVSRHKSVQRFFKCKVCGFKANTLDSLYPKSACGQCGNSMFEACGMKEQDISIGINKGDSELDYQSEMLLKNGTE